MAFTCKRPFVSLENFFDTMTNSEVSSITKMKAIYSLLEEKTDDLGDFI
jgi:hypothetical protein